MACFDESPLGVYNMVGEQAIPQGADWDVSIVYKEADIAADFSGYSGRMQIREGYDQSIILELSTDDGTIITATSVANSPNVVLKFTNAATSAMTKYNGIYDLELISPAGLVIKFLEGKFELRREVTK